MDIQAKRAARFRFLEHMYKVTGGDEHYIADMHEIGKDLGLSGDDINTVVQYLAGENLIEHHTLGGGIGITHYGVQKVEEAILAPEEETEYFPPVNIIHVGEMHNSSIQQAGQGSTQTVVGHGDVAGTRAWLDTLEASLGELKLHAEGLAEIQAEVGSVRAQLSSPKPKWTVIGECLKSIRTIVEGAAGQVVASGLLAKLGNLLGG